MLTKWAPTSGIIGGTAAIGRPGPIAGTFPHANSRGVRKSTPRSINSAKRHGIRFSNDKPPKMRLHSHGQHVFSDRRRVLPRSRKVVGDLNWQEGQLRRKKHEQGVSRRQDRVDQTEETKAPGQRQHHESGRRRSAYAGPRDPREIIRPSPANEPCECVNDDARAPGRWQTSLRDATGGRSGGLPPSRESARPSSPPSSREESSRVTPLTASPD